ncbi:MAG: hypothetical protein AVDCRST_MAG57-3551, partial [uncultured Blastococcus sp.]
AGHRARARPDHRTPAPRRRALRRRLPGGVLGRRM